ncbi:hypothetical protein [Siphonobacter sp. SORGH_AS_0500]|uniref:hypothetical protein n=1 Tax=Siphonobacter sp. SORGH_AS_0500 TaxID=1864824 RepID=UPI00285FE215|nr:hypothetical protein [Siphonobacter sp. SORGH_AS_0500]MDR6195186.1 hypothetical protein [Siphonobacter sp. SORGH_AS_0500]
MIKPLASLFAKKAAEKKKADSSETEEKKTKPDQGEDDELEPDDEDESEDDTDDEQEDESQDEPKKKSASVGKKVGKKEAAMVSIKASEYEKLKTDALAWNKNKAEFAVLQDWHKNAKGVGATHAKEDENTRSGRRSGSNSVAEKPWNKKAQERAEQVK